jgi:four helix bundle protein
MVIKSYRELDVYRAAFELQQALFALSKAWPAEERYALTDQLRRSSRSVGANVAEAWAKRKYPAHFLSKLTDADGELQETAHWLDTARGCNYIGPDVHAEHLLKIQGIGRMLGGIMAKHESFCQS